MRRHAYLSRIACLTALAAVALGLGGTSACAEEASTAASAAAAAAQTSNWRDRIESALSEPSDAEFIDTPLNQVFEYLSEKHQIPIVLDAKELVDEGIGTDAPVTCQHRDISLRSVLRLILRDLECTYIARDEVLIITTTTGAESLLEPRVYAVGDLVETTAGTLPGEPPAYDYDSLIDVLMTSVAPTTWNEVGGQATITEMPQKRSLVISQTTDVHDQIAELLAQLRSADAKRPSTVERADVDQPADDGKLHLYVYRFGDADTSNESGPRGGFGGSGGGFAAVPGELAQCHGDVDAAEQERARRTPAAPSIDRLHEIATIIRGAIRPLEWQEDRLPAGAGAIYVFDQCLIVNQTLPVQHEVLALLRKLGYPPRAITIVN